MDNRKIVWGRTAVLTVTAMCCLWSVTCASLAAQGNGPSTDVWIDVVKEPRQDRICVTVPMAYGFVVEGSVDPSDQTPISMEHGNLLLPNVKVEVKEPDAQGNRDYTVRVTGAKQLPLKNYSTMVSDQDGNDPENPKRIGLPVKVKAYMEAKDRNGMVMDPAKRAYWTLTETVPLASKEGFKTYRLSLEDKPFDTVDTTVADKYWLNAPILVPAPEQVETNGWSAAGTANIPYEKYIPVMVEVGGLQGQYHQVEQSVKAGIICWEIEPDLTELEKTQSETTNE